MTVSLAPFIPTTMKVVRRMLTLAQVGGDDVVVDLGCGDGRILFSAIQEFGAKKAIGYEINTQLLTKIRQKLKKQHLEHRISIVNDDLLNANLAEASVITLYLTSLGNKKLTPKLVTETKRDTRIVSHFFPFDNWAYSKQDYFQGYTVYLYTTPKAFES